MGWLKYKIRDGYAVGIFDNQQEVLFDIEDLEMVSSHRWCIDSNGYPITSERNKDVRLHRLLMKDIPKGMVVDHINRNKLDNRKENLRICSQRVNCHNSSIRSNNKSGVVGVFLDQKVKRWRAQIYHNGKTKHIGIFDSFEDAVIARNKAEKEYYEGV